MKALVPYLAWLLLGVMLGTGIAWVASRGKGEAGLVDQAGRPSPGQPLTSSGGGREPSTLDSLGPVRELDLSAAREHLLSLNAHKSPVHEEAELARSLLQLAGEADDPEALVELFNALDDVAAAGNLVELVFARLARHDPKEAFQFVDRLQNTQLKHQAVSGLFRSWAENDPKAALSFVTELPSGLSRDRAKHVVLREYAISLMTGDPLDAMKAAAKSTDAEFTVILQGNVLDLWKDRDLDGAFRWVTEEADEKVRAAHLGSVLQWMSREDPSRAIDYTLTMPQKEGEFHAREILSQWAAEDPAAATRALRGLPDEMQGEFLVRSFAERLAYFNPDDAIALAGELPAGEMRNAFWGGVIGLRSEKDVVQASQLLSNLPEGDHRGLALERVVRMWAENDERSASEFLATLDPSPSRDRGVATFAAVLFSTDPERALDWATSIQNEAQRQKRVGNLLAKWRNQDAAAAEAWAARKDGVSQ